MTARCSLVLAFVLAVVPACQGGGNSGPSGDDDPGADAGVPTDGGGPTPTLQCSHTRVLEEYPWGVTAGTYVAQQDMTFGIAANGTQSPTQRLNLEVWAVNGVAPNLPLSRTFTPSTKYASCDTCMVIGEGCDAQNNCTTFYFAQAGIVNILEATRSASGRLWATGSNLVFAEWSMENDAPVADGRCIKLEKYSIDTEWGGEGGTCSGDSCSSSNPCCSDSPYCTLGNNSIGRYCSDFCGESGDGCTGPNDCCSGFECFLGTCISDTCGNDPCTAGLDEGGSCCETAPYCTGGRCSGRCGDEGVTCGGDLDCCTGLTCNSGTCN